MTDPGDTQDGTPEVSEAEVEAGAASSAAALLEAEVASLKAQLRQGVEVVEELIAEVEALREVLDAAWDFRKAWSNPSDRTNWPATLAAFCAALDDQQRRLASAPTEGESDG